LTGIRTAMVTTPALLRDLIRQLMASRVELDVVAELTERRELPRRLEAIHPDLVIIGLRRSESTVLIHSLLLRVPAAKFITLSSDGRSALGFELRLYQTDLGDASADRLSEFVASRARASVPKSRDYRC
jgi:DNA-binding NarL/FixJ family response regulator